MDMLYRLVVRCGLGREEARGTRDETKEKTRKKFACCVGWAIFSRVFWLSQKATKKEEAFSAGPTPPSPQPHVSAFPDSTKLRATFGDRLFISATGNKH